MSSSAKLPKGMTLTKLVQDSVKSHSAGKWETLTVKSSGAAAVLVAFADQNDFDLVKAHHKGKLWQSTIAGSVAGFSVVLP